jgi:hypothetical protein
MAHDAAVTMVATMNLAAQLEPLALQHARVLSVRYGTIKAFSMALGLVREAIAEHGTELLTWPEDARIVALMWALDGQE